MKKRILFVDDERNILDSLRDCLRRQRQTWDMVFALSGAQALQAMEQERFDVIVSDMKMPEMDGATLLKKVQDHYPNVVRIVLSGHAEYETILRALPVAHQYLSKPSNAETIVGTIERACNLQELIQNETVQQVIGGIEKLPSAPRVYSQIMTAINNESTTTDDITLILRQDMAMCAKILQLVNSAFFRLPRSISRIEEAVFYLGLNTIKEVALNVELFRDTGRKMPQGLSLDDLQIHAIKVGSLAAEFFTQKKEKEDAFVAGLLHDIGKLVFAVELPQHFHEVILEMKADPEAPMYCIEQQIYGTTHAEIGGYLLGIWGLPNLTVEAVANHHAPTRVNTRVFEILAAIHIADALVNELEDPATTEQGRHVSILDLDYVETLGLKGRLPGWREMAGRQAEEGRPR
jgi:HD-like signal output (HDOD) protein/CheY-like chemotaxis protein